MCYKTLFFSLLLSTIISLFMNGKREVIISPQIFNGPVQDGSEYGGSEYGECEKDIFEEEKDL